MRQCLIIAFTLWVTACAIAPSAPQSLARETALDPARVSSLQPQTLQPGRCGIFLFERRAPNHFVLFEDQSARRAQIVHAGQIHELTVSAARGAFVDGDSFSRVYQDAAGGLSFTLMGDVGGETGSGPRLENVLLTAQTPDGGRVVRPLGGVRSCQGEAG
jgi:hypothetical protein